MEDKIFNNINSDGADSVETEARGRRRAPWRTQSQLYGRRATNTRLQNTLVIVGSIGPSWSRQCGNSIQRRTQSPLKGRRAS